MANSKSRGHVVINWEECKGCSLCVDACPKNVLELSDTFNKHGYHPSVYIGEGCTGCGICFYQCPEPGAITVFKRWDQMEETAYCPHCKGEHKVFASESNPEKLYCANCVLVISKTGIEAPVH